MSKELRNKLLGGALLALALWLAIFPDSAGRWVGTFKAGIATGERAELRKSFGLPPERN